VQKPSQCIEENAMWQWLQSEASPLNLPLRGCRTAASVMPSRTLRAACIECARVAAGRSEVLLATLCACTVPSTCVPWALQVWAFITKTAPAILQGAVPGHQPYLRLPY